MVLFYCAYRQRAVAMFSPIQSVDHHSLCFAVRCTPQSNHYANLVWVFFHITSANKKNTHCIAMPVLYSSMKFQSLNWNRIAMSWGLLLCIDLSFFFFIVAFLVSFLHRDIASICDWNVFCCWCEIRAHTMCGMLSVQIKSEAEHKNTKTLPAIGATASFPLRSQSFLFLKPFLLCDWRCWLSLAILFNRACNARQTKGTESEN